MPSYPTYKLGEIITDAIGGDWGKAPDFLDESYELAYCIRGAEYKNWADDNGSTAVLRKIKYINLQKRQLKEGDIIVEISGGGPEQPVGRTEVITKRVLSNFKGSKVLCTNFLRLIRPNAELVDAVFLNYYLKFFYSTGEIIKYQAGSNNLRNLKFKDYLNLPIPLPPLPTQQAIVTRIETLFTELDKAAEHLRTAQQQLKTYRQAVLRDAFKGNLTKEWRKHNHISDETWEEKSFSSIAEIKSNLVDVSDYKDYPHIAPDNIEKETGKLLEYHTIAEDGVISGKHRFFTGQILYSKIRPNLSKVVIVSFDGLCSADMYPIEAKGNTKFLWYQMLSDRFVDYASNSGSRTVLPKINQKGLSIIPMKICSIEEQNEVVIQIESRLSQAEAAEASIAEALQKTEALRQSILKKAFSGELV